MSLFVTFEGIDGTGKSTQINRVRDWLSAEGYDVLVSREPGGSELGEAIRSILLNPHWKNMSARTEFFLYSASRSQLVDEIVKPYLSKPRAIVLLDRYDDSSTAYQGGGRALGLEAVESINSFATVGLVPDVTFVLDLNYETALERRRLTGQNADRLEENNHEFFELTRAAYHKLCRRHPERMYLIDATNSEESVFAEICSILKSKLFSYAGSRK
jgi:dTMP kinase